MKETEIRIGNLISLKSFNNTNRWIRVDSVCEWEGGENLLPILLTPEIITSCGFNHAKNEDEVWEQCALTCFDEVFWISGMYFLEPRKGNTYSLYKSTDEDVYMMLVYDVKHLHQLQNLIFALTGEELSISHPNAQECDARNLQSRHER